MPSPTLLEWCTTPISSLQQSVHEILNKYTKRDFQVPSRILEIQGLDGQNPGDKWRSLNAIVNGIVENVKNGDEPERQLSSLTPSLLSLAKTNVGVKLQLSNFIVESLKSEDASINKKALSARWFFDGGNPRVTADYFVKDILPFVSVRTRLDIVKRLARGLRGYEAKAQEFFGELVDLYGVQENLPILTSCSESFIFDSISRYKIVLPPKILKVFYSRCSRDIVVRYLQLSNKKNAGDNDKGPEIRIHDYDAFLPKLIRHHPQDFVALYELTPEKILPTLSCRRTAWLLANAKDAIISRSDIFLKLLQPKVVKMKLSREDLESMLENYLPNDVTDFLLDAALDFVNAYCDDIQILMRKFEKVYGRNLLDYARKLIESDTKSAASSGLKLLRKLSSTERDSQVKLLLANVDGANVDLRNALMSYLHTGESLPYFKDKICKSCSADERIRLIGLMIVSCGVQNSKNDLLDVLRYFRESYKNEQNMALYQFLERLKGEFALSDLDETHWSVLRDVVGNARARKELFKSHVTLMETVLEAMLRHAITRKARNERHVEEAIEMMVECKAENFSPSWNVFRDNLALEKECLERFFLLVPVKYPEQHSIYKEKNDRLVLALSLLKSIESYNSRTAPKKAKLRLSDYPWIMKLAGEFVCRSETGFRKELLARLVKLQAPDFYEQRMSEGSPAIRDIGNGDAIRLLKRQPEKVLAHWLDYLNEARGKLGSDERANLDRARERLRARRFVAATKWHSQLPVKFIEACLSDIKAEGSLAVLGILLPGETFEQIAATYAPKQAEVKAKKSFEMTRAALEAMRLTNPPVCLASLQAFCRSAPYLCVADGTLASLARRVTVDRALEFARSLAGQPQAALMKRGIRLAKSVATKQQFRELLAEAWAGSSQASIRRLLAKMIFDNFVGSPPHASNWQLMLSCLRGLTPDVKEVVQNLNDIEKIDARFLSDYVEEYLAKVEEIFAASLDFEWRTKCVCLLVESFDDSLTRHVSEDACTKILRKYFFDADCTEISRSVRTFAVRYYLLACHGDDVGPRLRLLVDILKTTSESFDVSHPKKRRYYPANCTIQEFFGSLLSELCASDSGADSKLRVVESVLDVFKMSLCPWQEPASYVSLNLYREYLLSTSPEDFGIRAAKRIGTLVEDFSSNEPIADIADCLNDFVVFGKIFRSHKNPYNLKMSLIEGLLQGDEYYGSLASTKMLHPSEVAEYDERYDRLISVLRQMKNSSIQYNLYQHLNNLAEQ